MYDVIIIGGGPAGLMAGISAAEKGGKVLLVDKGTKLGRKLAISGGGRCNVTNRRPIDEIIQHIPGNGRFLYSAFSIFNNEDIISFFHDLGVKLKEEDNGRMFPVSDSAQSVVDAMLKRLQQLRVDIRTNTAVETIEYDETTGHKVLLRDGQILTGQAIVLAVGGKSVPQTGSTGDGYAWAEKAGHTITELFPTEVPITSLEPFIKDKSLQGLSLQNVALSVWNPKGKLVKTHQLDMIFTHFGLSGPAALRCSQYVLTTMKKFNAQYVNLSIDALPTIHEEQLFQQLTKLVKEEPKKAIKNTLKGLLQERYLLFLLQHLDINPQEQGSNLSHEQLRLLTKNIKHFTLKATGTLSLEKAFVTGGGISVKEVYPQTMASKLMPGLFFAGEILDIHGYTGGYNITAALTTGRLAGLNAAEFAHYQ